MATSIGQIVPVFLPGEPPDREAWQATVYRLQSVGHYRSDPACIDSRHFLPEAALPQWELSMKVVQLLGLQDPGSIKGAGTQTASAVGVMDLSESFFEPLVASDQKASLASLSL